MELPCIFKAGSRESFLSCLPTRKKHRPIHLAAAPRLVGKSLQPRISLRRLSNFTLLKFQLYKSSGLGMGWLAARGFYHKAHNCATGISLILKRWYWDNPRCRLGSLENWEKLVATLFIANYGSCFIFPERISLVTLSGFQNLFALPDILLNSLFSSSNLIDNPCLMKYWNISLPCSRGLLIILGEIAVYRNLNRASLCWMWNLQLAEINYLDLYLDCYFNLVNILYLVILDPLSSIVHLIFSIN